tara:strand:+ start:148 stop:882 length:735 start_codon:yes stop_codon:yes gene_type:complete
MKSKILKIAFSLVLTTGIISLVSLAVNDSANRKIKSIQISITDAENSLFLNAIRVRTHLDSFGQLIGVLEDELPLNEIHNHLMEIPSVRSASIYPTLNGELKINLTQKQPKVRVHPEEGPDFYIDELGLAMPLDPVHSERVPIIHAKNINEAGVGLEFLEKVDGDRFWSSLIDQIIVEPSGDIIVLSRIGSPIFIGTGQDISDQKKNLITFYREQVKTGNLKNYKRIDLSYKDQVIATRYAHLN